VKRLKKKLKRKENRPMLREKPLRKWSRKKLRWK